MQITKTFFYVSHLGHELKVVLKIQKKKKKRHL